MARPTLPRALAGRAVDLPRRALWQGKEGRHQTSVTAGTALHRTRTSLRKWFWAAYLVTTHTPTRSEVILPRVHGVFGNLKTWLRGTRDVRPRHSG